MEKSETFPGNYTDYREKEGVPVAELPAQEKKESKAAEPISEKPKTRKLSYNEQRELEQLDKDIPKLEQKKKALQESLNNETEYEKLQGISDEIKALEDELEEKEMRWLELSEV